MKLYMLACLLAIASSAALESATPTKKAPPKVDPVALSTANTASEATHSRATHSHHHQDKHATTITNITTAAVTIHPLAAWSGARKRLDPAIHLVWGGAIV